MSDTTWMSITFLKKDQRKVEAALNFRVDEVEECEEDGEIVYVLVHHANYGSYDQLQELAKKGVTYLAESGPGAEYGGLMYVGHKKKWDICDTCYDGVPSVRGDIGTCGVLQKDLDRFKEFATLYNQVKALLDAKRERKEE